MAGWPFSKKDTSGYGPQRKRAVRARERACTLRATSSRLAVEKLPRLQNSPQRIFSHSNMERDEEEKRAAGDGTRFSCPLELGSLGRKLTSRCHASGHTLAFFPCSMFPAAVSDRREILWDRMARGFFLSDARLSSGHGACDAMEQSSWMLGRSRMEGAQVPGRIAWDASVARSHDGRFQSCPILRM